MVALKGNDMLEATTHTATRNAIRRAHDARGQALGAVWGWLLRGGRVKGR